MDISSKGHVVAGAVTAVSSCLASAAITTVVVLHNPAETSDALLGSVIVAGLGLWRARQMVTPDEYEDDDDTDREPTVVEDPRQRRIDFVLDRVRSGTITAAEAEQLIKAVSDATPPSVPAIDRPPYGSPG